jgi:hypothetical protein
VVTLRKYRQRSSDGQISSQQLYAAATLVREWVHTLHLRKLAINNLYEQVALMRVVGDDWPAYATWDTSQPPISLSPDYDMVDGHSVVELNRAVAEILGIR